MKYEEMKQAVIKVNELLNGIQTAEESRDKISRSFLPNRVLKISQNNQEEVLIYVQHNTLVLDAVKSALNKAILDNKIKINAICPGEFPEVTTQEDVRNMEL